MVEEDKAKKEEEVKKEQEMIDNEQIQGLEKKPTIQEEQQDKIDKANEAAARLERANKKQEELIGRAEKAKVNDILGGKSEVSQEETKEQKEIEGAKALLPEGVDCEGVTPERKPDK